MSLSEHYKVGECEADEVFVFGDLWVTAHVWADKLKDHDRITWLWVRLVEHQSQGENGPLYPQDEHSRPGRTTGEVRGDVDAFCDGHIKWDGCAEWSLDRHCCGVREFLQCMIAILRVYRWASDELGFEDCDPNEAIAAKYGGMW